ncbi:MAG: hypothetical protein RL217_925 [Pseudomonadota bacterium]|jgi:riboflavin synthase
MFTGIVQAKLAVQSLVRYNDFASFYFDFPDHLRQGLQLGASVAINGTCLTVRSIEGKQVSFDAIAQTLKVTNLGTLQPGSIVNMERAARIGDEIGGHLLSGHIMRTVKVLAIEDSEFNRVVWFERPAELAAFILDKGFIALNGCSLTIAELLDDRFAVYLIPETRDVTTFGQVQVGDAINLEVDAQTQAVVETVRRVLASGAMC